MKKYFKHLSMILHLCLVHKTINLSKYIYTVYLYMNSFCLIGNVSISRMYISIVLQVQCNHFCNSKMNNLLILVCTLLHLI